MHVTLAREIQGGMKNRFICRVDHRRPPLKFGAEIPGGAQ